MAGDKTVDEVVERLLDQAVSSGSALLGDRSGLDAEAPAKVG
ncbi:hypothetical protein [Streptomyces sp. NPDC001068]